MQDQMDLQGRQDQEVLMVYRVWQGLRVPWVRSDNPGREGRMGSQELAELRVLQVFQEDQDH